MRWLIGLCCAAALVAGTGSAAGATRATNRPTDLPRSCTMAPKLAPVSPNPTFPTNYQILDAVPAALSTQYPSVYGGIKVAPSTPGESDLEINSHFVVLERVHDPALETEARSAYPAPLTVAFQITPRTAVCLQDIANLVGTNKPKMQKLGIDVVGWGNESMKVNVSVTNCSAKSQHLARNWFATRFGSAIVVSVCQKVPTFGPLLGT